NHNSDEAHDRRLLENESHNELFGGAQRAENADLASPFRDGGVHRKKNHQHTDTNSNENDRLNESIQRRHAVRHHQLCILFQRNRAICGENLFHLLDNGVDLTRVLQLHVKQRNPIHRTRHALRCLQRYEQPCAFSVFHNAGDLERVVQELHWIDNIDVSGMRINVVHDDFIRRRERPALVPNEAATNLVELVNIDTVNDLETA